MSLEESIIVGEMQINPDNTVRAQIETAVMKDGHRLSSKIDAAVIRPGDDYSGYPEKVQAVCAAVHPEAEEVADDSDTIEQEAVADEVVKADE